jgi:putative membrane protein
MAEGMMAERQGPVLIELDEPPGVSPSEAPPVPDAPDPQTAAMQRLAVLAGGRRSGLGTWFWRLLGALLTFAATVMAWFWVQALMAEYPVLGWIAAVLLGALVVVGVAIALKEWAAFARLRRLDGLHRAAVAAMAKADLTAARSVVQGLERLYAGRPEMRWGLDRVAARHGDLFDADGLLGLAEVELLGPLDQAARREIELSARQVATVTAVVPIPLADVITALAANLRMIRRIAEIYGGRSGALGSWRLVRSVFAHLIATGAVAVGDDLISSVAGGGLVSKVSRRFGEGIINAALTSRVGIAAMEVCRPLPFRAAPRPSVTNLLQRAVTGLFG